VIQALTLADGEPPAAPEILVVPYDPPIETEQGSSSGCALAVSRSVAPEHRASPWLLAAVALLRRARRLADPPCCRPRSSIGAA
jgi:hypothetical protein